MADRRMFHASVVGSDAFLDLPTGAQALYFHLGMRADDDGFVNGPRQVARSLGLGQEELDALIGAGFLLWFDGIAVLRHFRVANTLQNDRVKPLRYPEIAKNIYIDQNRNYTTEKRKKADNLFLQRKKFILSKQREKGKLLETGRIPNRTEPNLTEPNLTEPNRTEASGTEAADGAAGFGAPAPEIDPSDNFLKLMGGRLGQGVVLLSDREQEDLLDKLGVDGFDKYVRKLSDFILRNGATVNNHHATILKWWSEDRAGPAR